MNGLEQFLEDLVRRVVREELERANHAHPELVTIAQYAAARGIAPATVRSAIKAGRLGCVKAGRACAERQRDRADVRRR